MYYLTQFDDLILSGVPISRKITSANLCKPIHDIKNYSTSAFPFESGKCGKEGEKLQKIEYIENKKSFFDEVENIFPSF